MTTAVVFVSIWILPTSPLDLLVKLDLLVIAASLIVIFFSDLKYSLIPDEMVLTFTLGTALFLFLTANRFVLTTNFFVGLLSSLALLLIVFATKGRGLGLGDVKYVFPMGLLLGFPGAAVAFWVSFISGGTVALILVAMKLRSFKQTIPLGPFLVLGTIVAFFWSKNLLSIIGL